MTGEFGSESDATVDASDRITESSESVDVQHGRDGDQHWYDAVDDGRSVATVEGSDHPDGWFEMTRATAVHGEAGDRGVESLRNEFARNELDVRAAPDFEPVDGSGSRRDVSDLLAPVDRTGPGTADLGPERPDIPSRYPADYVPGSDADQQRLIEAHEADPSPEAWIKDINPGHEADVARFRAGEELGRLDRLNNCADCARSVQDTLDGRPRVAAAGTGENGERITEWAGFEPESTDYGSVEARLTRPGDSAVLGARGPDDFGHAFNAINIDGVVCYVDGQTGEVGPWPPEFAEDTTSLDAWFFTHDTRRP